MIEYLIAAAVLALIFGGGKKAPAEDSSGWMRKNPTTGLVEIKPEKKAVVLAWLGSYYTALAPHDAETSAYGGSKAVLNPNASAGNPAQNAVAFAEQKKMRVLIAVGPLKAGPGNFWVGPPGVEKIATKLPSEGGTWAILL